MRMQARQEETEPQEDAPSPSSKGITEPVDDSSTDMSTETADAATATITTTIMNTPSTPTMDTTSTPTTGFYSKASSPVTQLVTSPSSPTTSSPMIQQVTAPSSPTFVAPLDPRKPASRLSLIKPKPNQLSPPLFPIGGSIAFEWQFDSATLVYPPANLTVDVTLNSDPTKVWSVANVSGSTTSVSWNTTSVNNNPATALFMGFYTLNIYDPTTGKQGMATSGRLIPSSDLRFGLYVPGASIPKADGTISSQSLQKVFSRTWNLGSFTKH
ncbi:hypothetical protein EDD11_006354 [Mortierella claussenii]|nr:hypothetical protein EDD11_006354 [Mortierella claussenii]